MKKVLVLLTAVMMVFAACKKEELLPRKVMAKTVTGNFVEVPASMISTTTISGVPKCPDGSDALLGRGKWICP